MYPEAWRASGALPQLRSAESVHGSPSKIDPNHAADDPCRHLFLEAVERVVLALFCVSPEVVPGEPSIGNRQQRNGGFGILWLFKCLSRTDEQAVSEALDAPQTQGKIAETQYARRKDSQLRFDDRL